MKNRIIQQAPLFLVLATLISCAERVVVKQEITMPARIDGLKQSKKIAFTAFQGDESGIYTRQIENFFREIKVDGSPYFELVERQALDLILKEQKLSQSGVIEDNAQIEAGNISGADTLVVGSILEPTVHTIKTLEQRTNYSKCIDYAKNKKGKLYCVAYHEYPVDCFNISSAVQFSIKFIDVSTAKSNYSGNYSGNKNGAYCSDRGQPVDPNTLSKNAFQQALLTMRKDVAPYKEKVSIRLLDSDDGSKLENKKDALAFFETGVKMIEHGNIEVGCNAMRKASTKYNRSPAIYYNLGVCTELKANWDQALRFYKAAQSNITDEPLKDIPKAIKRMNERLAQQEKLDTQKRDE